MRYVHIVPSLDPDGDPAAAPAATDDQRAVAVDALQHAVGQGRLSLGEFMDRLDAVLAVHTAAEVAAVTADLPTAQPIVGSSGPASAVSVFGDVRMGGRWRLRAQHRGITVFGDVRYDLRDCVCSESEASIQGWTVFGDVVFTVPEGLEAELSGFTIFGDRTATLAAVPRQPETPLVRVQGVSLFGDVRLVSAGPGERAVGWRRALVRGVRPPPPPRRG